MSVNYNVATLDISNGLDNVAISAGRNYLILLEASISANVRVKLNDNMSDDIPLQENFAIAMRNNTEIYVSADPVPGEFIKIGQSATADDFHIITSPSLDTVIKDFSPELLKKLDKIANPYELSGTIQGDTSISGSIVSLFNMLLDCDKIVLTLVRDNKKFVNIGNIATEHSIYAYLNDKPIAGLECIKDWNLDMNNTITVESVRGMTLHILGRIVSSAPNRVDTDRIGYILQKYTLK